MTTAPDMIASIAPKSDQINAEDLLTGPVTVTVAAVTRGSVEQPVDFITEEYGPGRAYRPSKTMRRVIVAAWGKDTTAYVGRRITIYRDPEVMFGRDKVGGIKISHLSHIDRHLELALTVTRGKRASFAVEPLPDAAPKPITKAEATEFESRIAKAISTNTLDTIAADLKARDLGSHRAHLLSTWSDRKAAIAEQPAEKPSDIPPKSFQANVTPQQVAQLQAIRAAEKWEADDEWQAYIKSSTGCDVTSESELTEAQAQQIIDEFNSGSDQ